LAPVYNGCQTQLKKDLFPFTTLGAFALFLRPFVRQPPAF
jgi:hypothetical protein